MAVQAERTVQSEWGATDACGLACRIEPIIMSAGELEHEWAGTPGKLIRERYRKAAEVARVRR